jgi:hypothetical protein
MISFKITTLTINLAGTIMFNSLTQGNLTTLQVDVSGNLTSINGPVIVTNQISTISSLMLSLKFSHSHSDLQDFFFAQ